MTKRMLIDSTQEEETRVVVVDGNKLEDVEFETCRRKQIKGNIYLAKVMRVEPSLQACFVDYGGNKHGFLAFGEIHPDYYNLPQEQIDAIDNEVNDIIEAKKQALKEREAERERIRAEKAAAYAQKMAEKAKAEAEAKALEEQRLAEEQNLNENNVEQVEEQARDEASVDSESKDAQTSGESEIEIKESHEQPQVSETTPELTPEQAQAVVEVVNDKITDEEIAAEAEEGGKKHPLKKRVAKKRIRKKKEEKKEELKVLAEDTGLASDEQISDEVEESETAKSVTENTPHLVASVNDNLNDDDDDDNHGRNHVRWAESLIAIAYGKISEPSASDRSSHRRIADKVYDSQRHSGYERRQSLGYQDLVDDLPVRGSHGLRCLYHSWVNLLQRALNDPCHERSRGNRERNNRSHRADARSDYKARKRHQDDHQDKEREGPEDIHDPRYDIAEHRMRDYAAMFLRARDMQQHSDREAEDHGEYR